MLKKFQGTETSFKTIALTVSMLAASFAACGDENAGPSGDNNAPVAAAGADQTLMSVNSVTLDGTASNDPDGDTITYLWTQTSGISVVLSDATNAQPTFTAPGVTPDSTDTLVFSLVVNDGTDNSTADTVTVTVNSWKDVSAGAWHTLALKSDGTLWAWGNNCWGQIGQGDDICSAYDGGITRVGTESDWATIATGSYSWHNLALKSDGTLWAWGENGYGQVGTACAAACPEVTTPTQVGSDTDWTEISVGGDSSYARKTGGTLWAWGNNSGGILGLGTTSPSAYYAPTQVVTDSDWASISSGEINAMAMKMSGVLWGWGNNAYGQLVTNSVVASDTPLKISSATDWVAASTGGFHIVALRDDGAGNLNLWAWGRDKFGAVGIGCIEGLSCPPVEAPTQIGTANWSAVSGGRDHSLAIQSDGSLWAWGYNLEAQLGVGASGSDSYEYAPVRVETDVDWYSISAGSYYSVALKSDGTLYHWGSNTNDRYITGGANPVLTPTRIGYQ